MREKHRNMNIPDKTVGRLSLYRRLLYRFMIKGCANIYSHQIAASSGVTSAQVRRDLMVIGYSGSPNRGYCVEDLAGSIGEFLDDPKGQHVALVGIGNLGRAILAHFAGRRPKLKIVAAFDVAADKVNCVIHGCRCYPMTKFPIVVKRKNISVSILAVPANAAQNVAEILVASGMRGILNFAPVALTLPSTVYTQDVDMVMALEKVAYFARK